MPKVEITVNVVSAERSDAGREVFIASPVVVVVPVGVEPADPRAVAERIRDELVRIGQQNAGLIFGGMA
ncbi:MAG TPA: hypothetical protein VFS21_30235 [Roseiflexaceae bacterium]|nr:hypothetical protein [Roseiflexaceae bacterium]